MTDRERAQDEDVKSAPVVHGGEGDPLGGGVAELEESEDVSEGEPSQERRGNDES